MKIFASDLDGTLLNKDYQTDERINNCIQKVVDHHDLFVIVTGRSINGISNLDFVKNTSYLIVMNGAIILDNQFKILKETTIDRDVIKAIYKNYQSDNVEYISGKNIYMTISREKYLHEYCMWDLWNKKVGNDQDNLEHHLSIFKFDCRLEDIQDIVKINILELDNKKHQEKGRFIKQFDASISNQPFDSHVFELTSRNISKLNALKYLSKINHWNDEDVYVFGDGGNDVEMLNYYQHSYAPSNASNAAIKVAKEMIEANYDYGVSNKIQSLMCK